MGERFGLSENDITAITGWLRSQGLDVNWVSPSRVFIGFGGSALAIGRAFHTELQTYKAAGIHGGVELMSVSSDPMIPLALVPAIKSINGLYTVEDQPLHWRLDIFQREDGTNRWTPREPCKSLRQVGA
jgi:subtilase family serine protease